MTLLLRKAKSPKVSRPADETEALVLENLELRRVVADLLIDTAVLREQLQASRIGIERDARKVA